MRAGAHARTIFAGFGVSGSLLAAVGATFVIAGGVLAFDQWPGELVDPPAPSVAVASLAAAGAPQAPEAVALPPAVTAAPAAAPGPSGGDPGGTGPGNGQPNGPGGTPTDPTPQTPPATPSAPPAAGVPDTPQVPAGNPLVSTLESATGATADTVRSVGSVVPIAAPVTDLVGGLVDGAGQGVGGLLRGLGE